MKTRTHGLDKIEMKLVKLLATDCKTTGDVQATLKKLFVSVNLTSKIQKTGVRTPIENKS